MLNKIIKNRMKILEGLKNKIFKNEDKEIVAAARLDICKTNVCGFYDPEGRSEKAVLPGTACCGACGCSLALKTRCMSCICGLDEVGQEPLWKEIAND